MRKQDRITREHEQNRTNREPGRREQAVEREREQARGSASDEQHSPKPPRQPGKLPLPD